MRLRASFFAKIFWGSMPPDPPTKGHATHAPFLTRPPTSQLTPTPLQLWATVIGFKNRGHYISTVAHCASLSSQRTARLMLKLTIFSTDN